MSPDSDLSRIARLEERVRILEEQGSLQTKIIIGLTVTVAAIIGEAAVGLF